MDEIEHGIPEKTEPYTSFEELAASWWLIPEDPLPFGELKFFWKPPEIPEEAKKTYEQIYRAFNLSFHGVIYVEVRKEDEVRLPLLQYAEAWARVVPLENNLGLQTIVFYKSGNEVDEDLLVHELSHPFSDEVLNRIEILREEVLSDEETDLNPRLSAAITLWQNIFREGLAVLNEPTDTIDLDQDKVMEIIRKED